MMFTGSLGKLGKKKQGRMKERNVFGSTSAAELNVSQARAEMELANRPGRGEVDTGAGQDESRGPEGFTS